jgi:hypothetical protein
MSSEVKEIIMKNDAVLGAAIKMDHFQPAVDPRKQELLEARFLGARVSLCLVNQNTIEETSKTMNKRKCNLEFVVQISGQPCYFPST